MAKRLKLIKYTKEEINRIADAEKRDVERERGQKLTPGDESEFYQIHMNGVFQENNYGNVIYTKNMIAQTARDAANLLFDTGNYKQRTSATGRLRKGAGVSGG